MNYPWRLKGLSVRSSIVALNGQDAVLVLKALAKLRVRGPEVPRTCFRAAVEIAAAKDSIVIEQVVDALGAMATLQARKIPLIRKVLHPRLQLPLTASPSLVHKAALATIKLGSSNVDPATVDALFVVTRHHAKLHPNDAALLIAAGGLLSMVSHVQKLLVAPLSRAEAAAVADCFASTLIAPNATPDNGQPPCNAPALRVLQNLDWFVRELESRGGAASLSGNNVMQLVMLFPVIALARRIAAQGTTERSNNVLLAFSQRLTDTITEPLPLSKCVPGGFVAFLHENIALLTQSKHSLHIVEKLLQTTVDSAFAKALNSYDVAKLADSLTQGRWEGLLQLPLSTGDKRTVEGLVVSVVERLGEHVSFFQSVAKRNQMAADVVVPCAVLRCIVRMLNAMGHLQSQQRREASPASLRLLQVASSVCGSALSAPSTFATHESAAWALFSLSKLCRHLEGEFTLGDEVKQAIVVSASVLDANAARLTIREVTQAFFSASVIAKYVKALPPHKHSDHADLLRVLTSLVEKLSRAVCAVGWDRIPGTEWSMLLQAVSNTALMSNDSDSPGGDKTELMTSLIQWFKSTQLAQSASQANGLFTPMQPEELISACRALVAWASVNPAAAPACRVALSNAARLPRNSLDASYVAPLLLLLTERSVQRLFDRELVRTAQIRSLWNNHVDGLIDRSARSPNRRVGSVKLVKGGSAHRLLDFCRCLDAMDRMGFVFIPQWLSQPGESSEVDEKSLPSLCVRLPLSYLVERNGTDSHDGGLTLREFVTPSDVVQIASLIGKQRGSFIKGSSQFKSHCGPYKNNNDIDGHVLSLLRLSVRHAPIQAMLMLLRVAQDYDAYHFMLPVADDVVAVLRRCSDLLSPNAPSVRQGEGMKLLLAIADCTHILPAAAASPDAKVTLRSIRQSAQHHMANAKDSKAFSEADLLKVSLLLLDAPL